MSGVILVCFFFKEIIINKNYKFLYKNNLFIFFLIFYILILLSIFFSEISSSKVIKNIFYIRFILFSFAISYFVQLDNKIFSILGKALIFCFIFLFFDSIFQYMFKYNIFGYELHKPNNFVRVSSLFGDELVLGSYISRLLPLCVGLYLLESIKIRSIIKIFFLLTISGLLVVMSGERTSLFYYIFFCVIFFLKNSSFNKYKIYFLIIWIFILTTTLIVNKDFKNRLIINTINQIYEPKEISDGKIEYTFKFLSKHHQGHAIAAINIFKDNYLIGSGPQSFRFICKKPKYKVKYGCENHPHNTYVQLLSELGIFGFLIILIFFIIIVYKIFVIIWNSYFKKYNNYMFVELCFLTCFAISIFPVIPSGNFFNNWISIIYYFPLGLYLAFNEMYLKKQK